jgi:hypothetical protein
VKPDATAKAAATRSPAARTTRRRTTGG